MFHGGVPRGSNKNIGHNMGRRWVACSVVVVVKRIVASAGRIWDRRDRAVYPHPPPMTRLIVLIGG